MTHGLDLQKAPEVGLPDLAKVGVEKIADVVRERSWPKNVTEEMLTQLRQGYDVEDPLYRYALDKEVVDEFLAIYLYMRDHPHEAILPPSDVSEQQTADAVIDYLADVLDRLAAPLMEWGGKTDINEPIIDTLQSLFTLYAVLSGIRIVEYPFFTLRRPDMTSCGPRYWRSGVNADHIIPSRYRKDILRRWLKDLFCKSPTRPVMMTLLKPVIQVRYGIVTFGFQCHKLREMDLYTDEDRAAVPDSILDLYDK